MKKLTLILIISIVSLELTSRLLDLDNFPLYEKSDEAGYFFKKNQSGIFFGNNEWFINNYGMIAKSDYINNDEHKILLIGDSIVYGGNNTKQMNRVGMILEDITSIPVFSIAAGSWAFENELIYLNKLNLNLNNKKIIFILNSGDFGKKSRWDCEKNHPTQKPDFLMYYLLTKYVIDYECNYQDLYQNTSPNINWQIFLKHTIQKINLDSIYIILYPNRNELINGYNFRDEISQLKRVNGGIKIFNFNKISNEMYRDPIHPNILGNKLLATYISDIIKND